MYKTRHAWVSLRNYSSDTLYCQMGKNQLQFISYSLICSTLQ